MTYGSNEYLPSMERIVQEAKDTNDFDVAHEFTRKDIDEDFILAKAEIFDRKRGDGFWLWKPYFVWCVIQKEMREGDLLFYADAGCEFMGMPVRTSALRGDTVSWASACRLSSSTGRKATFSAHSMWT